jgi:hypothetical protein
MNQSEVNLVIEFPIPDLLDRLSIAMIKLEKIGSEGTFEGEVRAYSQAIQHLDDDHPEWDLWMYLEQLVDINKEIWGYESDLRKGQLQCYDTAELRNMDQDELLQLAAVGLAAVRVRNVNRKRKTLHNKLVELTNSGFRDAKVNHASESVRIGPSES